MRDFLSRFAAHPSLVAPEHGPVINASLTTLAAKFGDERQEKIDACATMEDGFWPSDPNSFLAELRPYNVKDGVLTIPVMGVLLSGFPYQAWDWATGYEYIAKALDRGLEDSAVKGIAFNIDSPGGEVRGNFDLVDHIAASRDKKPMAAFANTSAYSAAYNIAAAVGPITVERTGGVGSIGVVTSHVDYSKYLENAGIKVTFIYAGAHKVDGNPYEPLPDAVKARIQERIDSLYSVFVEAVAKNRGMEESAVRATEALTYSAQEAIKVGLADSIGTMEKALADFVAAVNSTTTIGAKAMTDKTQAAAPDNSAAIAEAVAKANADSKARISAIMDSDEAKTRPAAAKVLAMDTDMSAEAAKAALAKMPEEPTAGTKGNPLFAKAMEGDNPNLGGSGKDGDKAEDPVARILAAQAAAHGVKPKAAA